MLSAKQMTVIKEQAYGGYPSLLPGVCRVRPLLVGEMLEMGSDEYSKRVNLLTLTTADVEKLIEKQGGDPSKFEDLNPLSYLLQSADKNDMFFLELKWAFSTFINEEVLILPDINAVLVGPMAEKRLITKDNFDDFETILRLQNRKEVPEPPPENESPQARKMRLLREKRDAVKRKQQQKKGETQDLAELLEIADVFGIDYKNKSIYAFYGLVPRYQRREKWENDVRMLCAGADPKKIKVEYWGENPKT